MEQLKNEKIWGVWRYELDEKRRRTKVPYVAEHTRGQSNRPESWLSFASAEELKQRGNFDGLAIFFSGTLCGIDVDGHKDGQNPLANEILNMFGHTYAESSPSGTGIHILFRADRSKLPLTQSGKLDSQYYMKNPKNEVEFYAGGVTNRFFTFTGKRVSDTNSIADASEIIPDFLNTYMVRPQKTPAKRACAGLADPIVERLNKARNAKNGRKFVQLYDNGDTSEYNNDKSSADLALCLMLAYWLDRNPDTINTAFKSSALYRPKWDEKRGAQTYGEMTIATAISTCVDSYHENLHTERADRLTIEILADELKHRNIGVKLNLITHDVDVTGEKGMKDLLTRLHSDLSSVYRGVTFDTLKEYLEFIARGNEYNPVLEYLHTLKWDGADELERLYKIMGVQNDELSKALIRKWLLQSIALLKNTEQNPISAVGVLTLVGEQGIGKTSIFRKLAIFPRWFKEGATIDTRDKDTLRRACSYWIVELGEVETTMKSDISMLKAFITAETDEYRVAYGRLDEKHMRRSSLCATCNSTRYLIDDTGNRRWWTVPVEDLDIDAILKYDARNLWAQIVALSEKGCDWHLTSQEARQLNERNDERTKLAKGEQEVKDILSREENNPLRPQTVTEWKSHYRELDKYNADTIAKALARLGYTSSRMRIEGKQTRMIDLPIPSK